MIRIDESALICDLAETYHIYQYRSLPATLVATLAVGLGDETRIKMKMDGRPLTTHIEILATIADLVGQLGGGRGFPITDLLCERVTKKETTRLENGFKTPDEAEEFFSKFR